MSSTDILSDAERAALWPAVTDEISDLELEALERGWKRERAAREGAIFALGLVAGALVAVIFASLWLLLA